MIAPPELDIAALEEDALSIFHKELADNDYTTEKKASCGSTATTLRNNSTSGSASESDIETIIAPKIQHDLELRQDLKDVEAAPISEGYPDVKPFAWSRYAMASVYRRLFSLVFLGNLAAFIWIMIKERRTLDLVDAVAANLLAVGLARQPLVVNLLFIIFGSIPRCAPMWLRTRCAKVYCYGGLHSGAGIASLFWYVGFVVLLTIQYIQEQSGTLSTKSASPAIVAISYVILALLLAIIVAAFPKIRFMLHDYFEFTHRFCGWAVVAFFWPLLYWLPSQRLMKMGNL
jgi:hypothetical protein